MKVLVTGGAGYIGSHTCCRLVDRGYKPVVVDNLSRGHRAFVQWGPLYEVDLLDESGLKKILLNERIEAVVHFAAYAYVGESVTQPDLYYENNVAGTLSLLKAMNEVGVKKLVFSSTCATYGAPKAPLIVESHPQEPVNPYGRSKWIMEQMIRDFNFAFGFRSISLRYFNAAGCHSQGMLYERHDPETHLIPLAIRAMEGTGPELSIFGSDYPTPDGTCIRDYIHVFDLADAHIAALRRLEGDNLPEACNLGTGQGTSVLELIQEVEAVGGKRVPFHFSERRPGDPSMLVADPSYSLKALSWKSRYTLRDMVESAIRAERKHAGLMDSALSP
jgi:UDP-arabinose 4-epimerase